MTPEDKRLWHLTDQHRWEDAVEASRSRLIHEPESAYAFQTLAMSLPFLSQLDEAWSASEQACRLAPEDPWNHIVRSRVAVARRTGPEAVESARRAVELGPDESAAHVQLAEAHLTHLDVRGTRHFRPEGALAPAGEALRLTPMSPWARSARAHALKALGQRQQAIRAYHAVLEVEPNWATVYSNLGILYAPRRPVKAVRSLTACLAIEPGNALAQSNLGRLVYDWTRRLVWLWLAAGAALVLARWFVPGWADALAIAAALGLSVGGTLVLFSHLPRRSLPAVWSQRRFPTRAAIAVLSCVVATVTTIAFAATVPALVACLLLCALALVQWKAKLGAIERRVVGWVRRESA